MSRFTLPETTAETLAEGFQYSYEIQDAPEIAGEGKPRRSFSSKGDLLKTPPGITNLLGNLQQTVQKNGSKNFMGTRVLQDGKAGPYQWMSYEKA